MKPFLFIFFCLDIWSAAAQDKNQFYALDAHMNQTVLDSSKYILWIHQKDSAHWQWDYYYTWGSLVKSTNYADHDGTLLNGRFCLYNSAGFLDSTGVFERGRKNGSFVKFRTYRKDSLVEIKEYDYLQDSLISITDLTNQKDTDTTDEKESEYPGGLPQWTSFLIHNLIYPERAQNKEIQGQVRIRFMVETDGTVSDPYIEKSVEYSLDQATLDLIIKSGKWVPGTKKGIAVKTYKVQPVNYRLETQ